MKTFFLLTAAVCVTGQAAYGQSSPAYPASNKQAVVASPQKGQPLSVVQYQAATVSPPDNRGFLQRVGDRFSNLFYRQPARKCTTCNQQVQVTSAPTTAEPPVAKAPAPPIELPSAVRRPYAEKIGHEADYSWITGQLYYIHADGGFWVLRYATVDTEDKYGGSVVLQSTVNMRNFREGDLVSVRGEILSEARTSRHVGGALYRAHTVDMIDRAD